MSKKTILLNEDFLKTPSPNSINNNNNKTLKNHNIRERKEKPKILIKPNNVKKQLLQKIKNYQNKDEIVSEPLEEKNSDEIKENTTTISTDFEGEFNKSLNFLQNLSLQKTTQPSSNNKNNDKNNKTLKKRKAKNVVPQVSTELPEELCIQTAVSRPEVSRPEVSRPEVSRPDIIVVDNNQNSKNTVPTKIPDDTYLTLKQQPAYSNLKNGSKPTYREVHNKTQKKFHLNVQPITATFVSSQSPSTISSGPATLGPATLVPATLAPAPDTLAIVPLIEEEKEEEPNILKRKITRTLKYKLGKKGNKVAVLIKNNKTRKLIQYEQALLKKKSILDVKNYLRKKNLLKIGSEAPPDILRQIYENSILAGDLNNKSKETLIHNYMNDK